jgi:SAM-dependent methyltransferase
MRDPGAPVDLYRLLEPADEPELIDRELPEGAEILELGCGSGRITHALIGLGRRVVAVDMDPEMLDLIEGAEKIHARIEELDLGRTFRGIVMMSNLVNTKDEARRLALLLACQRHLAPNGILLIERYDPESGADPTPTEVERYGLVIRVSDIRREGPLLYETIEYDAGDRGHWRIRLEGARILSDDEMLASLTAAHLRLVRWIDERRRWLAATLA